MHRECGEELGRCPTFGCEGDPLSVFHEVPEDDELEALGRDFRALSTRAILGAIGVALALGGIAALILFSP